MTKKTLKELHARVHKKFDPRTKNLDFHDIGLTKFSVTAAVLFLLTAWPALCNLALSVKWGWYLVAMILFGIRPILHFFGKSKKK
jgi:hypothetical protein